MHFLIGLHAALGELGALMFLWVLVEMLDPNETRIRRAKKAAMLGLLFLVLSWILGGYYYLGHYQADVKAVIKAGPDPWTHSIITETKEHVFIFLPFLATIVWGMFMRYGLELQNNKNLSRAVVVLAALIILVALSMAGMGYLISSGFRSAHESLMP
ncbi:hypothetical protein HY967_01025 [Candidatus Jorgensenbacteria bacterium]|nr:hypothetical protein [Candidatus Jorgensenbacteria bacterium]